LRTPAISAISSAQAPPALTTDLSRRSRLLPSPPATPVLALEAARLGAGDERAAARPEAAQEALVDGVDVHVHRGRLVHRLGDQSGAAPGRSRSPLGAELAQLGRRLAPVGELGGEARLVLGAASNRTPRGPSSGCSVKPAGAPRGTAASRR